MKRQMFDEEKSYQKKTGHKQISKLLTPTIIQVKMGDKNGFEGI